MNNNSLIPLFVIDPETFPDRNPEIEALVRENLGSGIPEATIQISIEHAQTMYKMGRDYTRKQGETEEDVWKDFTSFIFNK